MNPQVVVDFIADTKQLQSGMAKAGEASSGFASKLGGLAKAGAIGSAIVGVGALTATLKIGFDEFSQGQQVAAQTNQVLKTTGGIANVTAKHVDTLATSLLNKTGIDDEAIKSNENLLLTFTNVRNEAGKGNDIFDQATKSVLDMSVAFKESGSSAAIQLGKALNDPVKGITALTRVGVSFTAQQKKQVETLVKSGHTLQAQKLILGELNRETGGRAVAAGKTLAGQLNILHEQFNNFAGDLVAKMIPAITQVVGWLREHWPQISAAVNQAVNQVLIPALSAFAALIREKVVPAVQAIVDWVVGHWPQISKIATTVFDEVARAVTKALGVVGQAFTYLKNNKDVATALAAAVGTIVVAWAAYAAITKVVAIAQAVLNAVMAANPIGLIIIAIAALVGALVLLYEKNKTAREIIQAAWADIQTAVSAVVDWISNTGIPLAIAAFEAIKPVLVAVVGFVQSQIEVLQHIIAAVMDVIHGNWGAAWDEIKAAVSTAISGILTLLGALAASLLPLVKRAGQAILTGLGAAWDALPGLARAAWNLLGSAITSVLGALKGVVTALGGDVVDGFLAGVRGAVHLVSNAVSAIKSAVISALSDAGSWLLDKGKDIIDGLVNGVKSVFKAVSGAIDTVKSKVTGAFSDAGSLLYGVGQDIINGFTNGISSVWQGAVDKVVGLYHKLPSAIRTVLGALSPSKVFFAIGTDTVDGFVNGLNAKMPQAEKAALTMAARVVEAAHVGLTNAGGQLSADLQQAFSAHQQAAETPAQKALRELQQGHDDAARKQALKDAQTQLDTATAGSDPAAIASAQQAVADASYNIQVAALQKKADAEAQALAGSQFMQQQAFDKQLAALQKYLDSAQATSEGARKRIKALTDKFGIDFAEVGSLLGKGFAGGLRDTTAEVVKSAGDLAAAVKKALKHGLEIHSPSAWTRDEIGVPIVQGIVVGMNRSSGMLDQATRSMVSAVQIPQAPQGLTLSQPTLSPGGSGSGDVHVRVFIGETELRGMVRSEVSNSNSGIARVLLAGAV